MAAETSEIRPSVEHTLTKLQVHYKAGEKLDTPSFLKDVYEIKQLGFDKVEKVDHLLKLLGKARTEIVGGSVLTVLQEGHRTSDVVGIRQNIEALRMLGLDVLPKVSNLIGILNRVHNLEEPIGPIHGPTYQDYKGFVGSLPRVEGQKNGAINGHRNQTPEEFVAGLPRIESQKDKRKVPEVAERPRFADLIGRIRSIRERVTEGGGFWPSSLQDIVEYNFEQTVQSLPPEQQESFLSLRDETIQQTTEQMYQDLADAIFEEKINPQDIFDYVDLSGKDFRVIRDLLDKRINLSWAGKWAEDPAPPLVTHLSYPRPAQFPHMRREDLVAEGVPIVGERAIPAGREVGGPPSVRPVKFGRFDETEMPPVEQLVALVPEEVKRQIEQQREKKSGGESTYRIMRILEEALPQIVEREGVPAGFIYDRDMLRIIYSAASPALRIVADDYCSTSFMDPNDPEYSVIVDRYDVLRNLEAGIDNVLAHELRVEDYEGYINLGLAVSDKTIGIDGVIAEFINYQKVRNRSARVWTGNNLKLKALQDSLITKLDSEQRETLDALRSRAEADRADLDAEWRTLLEDDMVLDPETEARLEDALADAIDTHPARWNSEWREVFPGLAGRPTDEEAILPSDQVSIGEPVVSSAGETGDQSPETRIVDPDERLRNIYKTSESGDYDATASEAGRLLRDLPGMVNDLIPILREVLQKDPRNIEAHRVLGDAYMRTGRFQQAIEEYNQFLGSRHDSS